MTAQAIRTRSTRYRPTSRGHGALLGAFVATTIALAIIFAALGLSMGLGLSMTVAPADAGTGGG